MRNLKTINKDVTHWPNKKMVNCTFIGTDNVLYDADILPEEAEILLRLRILSRNNMIKESELKRLEEMIESFGEAKYSDGYDSAETDFAENS